MGEQSKQNGAVDLLADFVHHAWAETYPTFSDVRFCKRSRRTVLRPIARPTGRDPEGGRAARDSGFPFLMLGPSSTSTLGRVSIDSKPAVPDGLWIDDIWAPPGPLRASEWARRSTRWAGRRFGLGAPASPSLVAKLFSGDGDQHPPRSYQTGAIDSNCIPRPRIDRLIHSLID